MSSWPFRRCRARGEQKDVSILIKNMLWNDPGYIHEHTSLVQLVSLGQFFERRFEKGIMRRHCIRQTYRMA